MQSFFFCLFAVLEKGFRDARNHQHDWQLWIPIIEAITNILRRQRRFLHFHPRYKGGIWWSFTFSGCFQHDLGGRKMVGVRDRKRGGNVIFVKNVNCVLCKREDVCNEDYVFRTYFGRIT